MWMWHAPVLYQAALGNDAVHGVEHLCFVSVGAMQWWALAGGHRARRGAATLAVFIAAFPATALGAAMLLAPRPWYPDYIRGTAAAALSDQQLAGVVMWAFGGLIYVIGAAILFGTWLNAGQVDELPVRPLPLPRVREVS
jgi:cytochrome c oxidase assembly factor CtaG